MFENALNHLFIDFIMYVIIINKIMKRRIHNDYLFKG